MDPTTRNLIYIAAIVAVLHAVAALLRALVPVLPAKPASVAKTIADDAGEEWGDHGLFRFGEEFLADPQLDDLYVAIVAAKGALS